jgi:hypothetical protein
MLERIGLSGSKGKWFSPNIAMDDKLTYSIDNSSLSVCQNLAPSKIKRAVHSSLKGTHFWIQIVRCGRGIAKAYQALYRVDGHSRPRLYMYRAGDRHLQLTF